VGCRQFNEFSWVRCLTGNISFDFSGDPDSGIFKQNFKKSFWHSSAKYFAASAALAEVFALRALLFFLSTSQSTGLYVKVIDRR